MILWTIQPAEIYNHIVNKGYYHFDDKISRDTAWRNTNGLSEYLIPIEFKFIRIIHRQPFFVSTSSIGGGAV